MSANVQVSPSNLNRLLAATLVIGIWVGTIQVQILYKADINEVAKEPMEKEQITSGLANITMQLNGLQKSVDNNTDEIRNLRDSVVRLETAQKLAE